MGYRGKVVEQNEARALRAEGLTMAEIAAVLGVSKSSVSLWTRDVDFTPTARPRRPRRGPNALQRRKAAEIQRLKAEGVARVGCLTRQQFLLVGTALYAAEGSKGDGEVTFTNTDPRMIEFFCRWLRMFFVIDESRLRLRLYLHEGLDVAAAIAFWCELTGVPTHQVVKPYRAVADASIRKAKHPLGCAAVRYCCTPTHRAIIGLADALLASNAIPG